MEQKDKHVEKIAIDEKEFDDIEIYNILNSENLPQTVWIIWK